MEHTIIIIASVSVVCFGLNHGPIRQTVYGKIRGKVTSRLPEMEVEEFLGVPYAAPPVGPLRFQRPKLPEPWDDIKTTQTIPPACPQTSWYYVLTHKPTFYISNEDCLYMNIFVPRVKNPKLLPVLLYVHGGSNRVGMGAMFDGDILAAYGQIVVVNFNYRLGVLGFYANRNEGIEGNNGLMDQVMAMKWVQQNIEFFDGDSSKVTIHGHSAGAGDVGLHLVSELTKGLFRFAVVHSGSPLAYWGVSECVPTSRRKIIPCDCQSGTSYLNHTKKYDELMSMSINDEFVLMDGEVTPYALVNFRPVLDGLFLKESPEKLLTCNKVHADSVFIAMARDEGFPYYDRSATEMDDYQFETEFIRSFKSILGEDLLDDLRKVYEEWKMTNFSRYPHHAQMESDIIFYVPMVRLADLISKWMEQVYLLSFEYVSQNLTGPLWQGVPHGWDLFYVFGVPLVGHPKHNYTPRDVQVSKTTMTLFSNYVKYGYLTVDGTQKLETYNSYMKTYNKLHFQEGKPVVTPEVNFRKPRIDFWSKHLFNDDFSSCSNNDKFDNINELLNNCTKNASAVCTYLSNIELVFIVLHLLYVYWCT